MWGAIFGAVAGVAKALFGGGASSGGQALASQVIDKVLPETEKEKQAAEIAAEDEDIKDVDSARSYNAPDMPVIVYQPGMGLIPFVLLWVLDVIDHIVDTVNHIIRPGFFIYLVGGFIGKWKLPDPKAVDPQMWTVFLVVVTFFFGARTLVKDVPAVINAIRK